MQTINFNKFNLKNKNNEEIKEYVKNTIKHLEENFPIEECKNIEIQWLYLFCEQDNIELVKYFIEKLKFDLKKVKNYESLLFCACQSGNLELVKYLIEGTNQHIKISSKLKKEIIVNAYDNGNLDMIKYLFSKYEFNRYSFNDLIKYLKIVYTTGDDFFGKKIEIIKYLVEYQYINIGRNIFKTLLLNACTYNNIKPERFKYLIEKLNYTDYCLLEKDYTNKNVVDYLIKTKKTNIDRILMDACDSGNLELVKYLIEKQKVDIHKDIYGNTDEILFNVCEFGYLDIAKYLIEEENIDINIKNSYGNNILFHAYASGNLELIKYLVEEKNMKSDINSSNLYVFFRNPNTKLVKWLLEKKIINVNNINFKKVFSYSLFSNRVPSFIKIIQSFIDNGFDITKEDDDGYSFIDYAFKSCHNYYVIKVIILYLLEQYPQYILEILVKACRYNNIFIIDVILKNKEFYVFNDNEKVLHFIKGLSFKIDKSKIEDMNTLTYLE